jgi:hypothetical protein
MLYFFETALVSPVHEKKPPHPPGEPGLRGRMAPKAQFILHNKVSSQSQPSEAAGSKGSVTGGQRLSLRAERSNLSA